MSDSDSEESNTRYRRNPRQPSVSLDMEGGIGSSSGSSIPTVASNRRITRHTATRRGTRGCRVKGKVTKPMKPAAPTQKQLIVNMQEQLRSFRK